MRRALLSAAAVTAAAMLAACGGGSTSGAASPAAAVRTYLTSVGKGDGSGACSVLSSELQKRALRAAHSQGVKASSCADLFSQVKAHLSPTQLQSFLHPRVARVSRTGNTATVTISGASSRPVLTDSGGHWLITGGIGF